MKTKANLVIQDMSTRDRYTWDLECPRCKLIGFAEVSEDAFPYLHGFRFHVDGLSEGFRVGKLGKSASDTELICVNCNTPV